LGLFKKMITVFTPTYNRASLLYRIYNCLCHQTFQEFEWVIIDDGSTDDTEQAVRILIDRKCANYPIRYYKKPNGGKHTAINRAVEIAQGELFLILDSDDTLPYNSLHIINDHYQPIKMISDLGGVCGLMAHHNGERIGSGFSEDDMEVDEISLRYQHHVTGDLAEVFKTSVLREHPFPEIPDERFCPEQLVWFRIAQKYKLRCFNQIIYYRDYLEGGLTDRIVKIRMESPLASMMTYQELLDLDFQKYNLSWKVRTKAAINYWRFRLCCTSHHKQTILNRGLTIPSVKIGYFLHFIPGYLMHIWDLERIRRKLNFKNEKS